MNSAWADNKNLKA